MLMVVLGKMFPFRNILFPTDFSAHAHAALKYAAGFARDGGGRVFLVNVQDARVPANLLTLPQHIFEEQENNWLLQLRSHVKELLADPLVRGVEVDPTFAEGDPPAEIVRPAVDHEVALITIATPDRNRFSRAFGGSIPEERVAAS